MTDPLYDRLPHHGAMRLIDEVVNADNDTLMARAATHHDPAHPLRRNGRLHGLVAVEYAAQACALHGVRSGRLGGDGEDGFPVVATVQRLELSGSDLDRAGPTLTITVRCTLRQTNAAVYDCVVTDGDQWHCRLSLGLMTDAGLD